MSAKMMVTLVSFPNEARHEVKVTRFGKRPRCVVLRYPTRQQGLNGYFTVAHRLFAKNALHRNSVIEN